MYIKREDIPGKKTVDAAATGGTSQKSTQAQVRGDQRQEAQSPASVGKLQKPLPDNAIIYDTPKKLKTAQEIAAERQPQSVPVPSPAQGYKSAYDEKIDALLADILGRKPFSYDVNSDALYNQYAEIYKRNAQMMMEDTVGRSAAMTGGYGNSWAQTAGAAAYASEMQELNDVVPELYQLAYDRYNAEGNALLNNYALLSDAEAKDYSRYRDAVSDARYENEWQYQKDRDAVSDARYENEWDRDVEQQNFENALTAGTTIGDTASLRGLGYDTSYLDEQIAMARNEAKTAEEQEALNRAITLWEISGDPSGLEALGINMSYAKKMRDAELTGAQLSNQAAYKSLYGGGSGDTVTPVDSGGTGTPVDGSVPVLDWGNAIDILKDVGTLMSGYNDYEYDADTVYAMLEVAGLTDAERNVAIAAIKDYDPDWEPPTADGGDTESVDEDDTESAGEKYLKKVKFLQETDFDSYNGIISQYDWETARLMSNKSKVLWMFATYEDYVRAMEAYLAKYGG